MHAGEFTADQIGAFIDGLIAEHTRTTLYTACRIRERIGVPANQPAERSAA